MKWWCLYERSVPIVAERYIFVVPNHAIPGESYSDQAYFVAAYTGI